jgi:hypothetical protein|eukprot:238636-Prymnesium_polylepis.1
MGQRQRGKHKTLRNVQPPTPLCVAASTHIHLISGDRRHQPQTIGRLLGRPATRAQHRVPDGAGAMETGRTSTELPSCSAAHTAVTARVTVLTPSGDSR